MGRICLWVIDDDDFESMVYDTSCDNRHEFIAGDIVGNNYKFCPYCGAKIQEVEKEIIEFQS